MKVRTIPWLTHSLLLKTHHNKIKKRSKLLIYNVAYYFITKENSLVLYNNYNTVLYYKLINIIISNNYINYLLLCYYL